MKRIGLDTSVVLRLLTGTPENLAKAALRYINECHGTGRHAVISDLVVAESYFALNFHYLVPKQEAISQLKELLSSGYIFPEPSGKALEALELGHISNPGLVDRIIREQYLVYAEEVISFDKALGRLEKVRLLKG